MIQRVEEVHDPAEESPVPPPEPQTPLYSSPEEHFEQLIRQITSLTDHHRELLRKAFEYASKMHSGQYRRSGELYIHHPLEVCAILSQFTNDPHALAAAILHDTVEDTEASIAEIGSIFGASVADLVAGLTKVSKIQFQSKHEKLAENFRRMVMAMAKDLRVVVIKLCDRLHNMRTIDVLGSEKSKRIAEETMDIYAPLANRLGVFGIKNELEDLCLKLLKPEIFAEISAKVARKKQQRKAEILDAQEILTQELASYGLKNFEVSGRPKHFNSIYKKMVARKLVFEEIYDLMAFRVLVDSLKDCYEVLGIVHALWKPKPGRFKDYIAMPKANRYQSLHTTVVGPMGALAEIQIRTYEMHQVCEYGVTAHWLYKEKKEGRQHHESDTYSWLRQILEWQKDVTDSAEYIKALKVDLFEHEIFVFSPMGDVFRLPENATPLDFAFSIHTGVGLKTRAAKVNQRMVSLRHKLRNGDMVEIITADNQRPGKNWLSIVTTSKAKSKIRSYLRSEERASAKEVGKTMLAQQLDKFDITYEKFVKNSQWVESALALTKTASFDEFVTAVGFGKVVAANVLERIYKKEPKTRQSFEYFSDREAGKSSKKSHVVVSGLDHVLVTIARCCNPVPGEDIIGYITRGRGVTVHQWDCEKALDLDPARRIEVRWNDKASHETSHIAFLRVETKERHGLASEVTSCISSTGANILKANIHVDKNMMGVFHFKIAVKSIEVLEEVITKIERISEVVSVSRRSQ